jgi:hypothetical protein
MNTQNFSFSQPLRGRANAAATDDGNTTRNYTIYDIKRLSESTSPYFFASKTLKFFGQTMRSFSVRKQHDGRVKISAPMIDRRTGRNMGETVRYFNPLTNVLEHA